MFSRYFVSRKGDAGKITEEDLKVVSTLFILQKKMSRPAQQERKRKDKLREELWKAGSFFLFFYLFQLTAQS